MGSRQLAIAGRRTQNWRHLHDHFADRPDSGLTQATTTTGADTTWMRFRFTVPTDATMSRNDIQTFLEDRGVSTRMVWTGTILRQPGFAAIEHRQPQAGLPNCDHLMNHALSLPIHHGLKADHMDYITTQVDALLEQL